MKAQETQTVNKGGTCATRVGRLGRARPVWLVRCARGPDEPVCERVSRRPARCWSVVPCRTDVAACLLQRCFLQMEERLRFSVGGILPAQKCSI